MLHECGDRSTNGGRRERMKTRERMWMTDLNLVHEGLGHEVLVLRNIPAVYADGEVLGHVSRLYRVDDRLLHVLGEHLASNPKRS